MMFHSWFVKQQDRKDIVGFSARWFYGKRRGSKGDLGSEYLDWLYVVEYAPKSKKEAVKYGFETAWQEYHSDDPREIVSGGKDADDGETFKVYSTVGRLTKVFKIDGEEGPPIIDEETLDVRRFRGPVAKPGLGVGLTVNLGNWESARVDARLDVPCYPEEVDDMGVFITRWITDKVDLALTDLLGVRTDPGRKKEIEAVAKEGFEEKPKKFERAAPKDDSQEIKDDDEPDDGDEDGDKPVVEYELPEDDDDDILF